MFARLQDCLRGAMFDVPFLTKCKQKPRYTKFLTPGFLRPHLAFFEQKTVETILFQLKFMAFRCDFFHCVCKSIAFVDENIAFVGENMAFVGESIAFVGRNLAFLKIGS